LTRIPVEAIPETESEADKFAETALTYHPFSPLIVGKDGESDGSLVSSFQEAEPCEEDPDADVAQNCIFPEPSGRLFEQELPDAQVKGEPPIVP